MASSCFGKVCQRLAEPKLGRWGQQPEALCVPWSAGHGVSSAPTGAQTLSGCRQYRRRADENTPARDAVGTRGTLSVHRGTGANTSVDKLAGRLTIGVALPADGIGRQPGIKIGRRLITEALEVLRGMALEKVRKVDLADARRGGGASRGARPCPQHRGTLRLPGRLSVPAWLSVIVVANQDGAGPGGPIGGGAGSTPWKSGTVTGLIVGISACRATRQSATPSVTSTGRSFNPRSACSP